MKETPMNLNFSIKVSATDFPKREISGRIVTWNEVGSTSAGETLFTPGSITFGDTTKLLLEHKREAPIGFLKSYKMTDEGIDAVFSIGNTTAGNDSLVEASSGLRDGFSVGVIAEKYKNIEGILTISASSLKEVSLVTDPAIASAKVAVAASENSDPESLESEETNPTNEGENEVEITPTVPDAPAETVEAAKVVNLGSAPLAFTKPRSPIITPGNYLEHTIRAGLGNEDSRQYVKAADDSFTTNPAFSPVSYLRDVATNTNADRPVIEACGGTRPLNSYGMTVSIPKITANSTAATVAEGGDPTGTTAITSAYVNATVIKKAGFQRYSVELLDRSDPSFYDIMLQNLRDAYAQATDAYVIAQITAGGTQATAQDADSDGIIGFVSTESPAAYAATKRTAKSFVSGTSIWSLLMGATDTTGRPIYNAGNPMNNAGSAIPTSIRGNVLGLDYYVDPNMVSTSIDESAFIIEPRSIEIFESPALQLATNVPTTGEIEIMLYGYIAAQATFAGGLRRFNLT
ncbi:Phage major capsid protein, HK97 [uncultured Caudovirales phage]|uniref:Phage major capsid protein, HK97 n=1 Tax=uncultured Caudovirales phage TaxID=2100421 RepID=A0A6J5P7D3_9CAUD|nr:Phage major capsid protein, HK97 [uncultured Caudovirales phage]